MSLLELLHPDGRARTSLVFGSNCPEILQPDPGIGPHDEADLLILAPSAQEWGGGGWAAPAVACLAERLTPDGVGYVLAPARWRFEIGRRLRSNGLLSDTSIGHLPDWSSSHYLVPLDRIPTGYAFSAFIRTPAWKRYLAKGWFRLPGAGRFLGYVWPSAGLVVRRPGARPLFEWLFRDGIATSRPGSALIHTGWRGPDGVAIVYRFSKGESQPSVVAKVALRDSSSESQRREGAVLKRLGPGALAAGARVPTVVHEQNGDQASLLQTVVGGQPAADLLRLQPDQLTPLVEKVAGWLERWHRATVLIRPVQAEQLDQALLKPAALLAPFLANAESYQVWLAAGCSKASGLAMPFVAAHNDLTMANILIDENGRLGVIDWETGREENFPLVDLFYALTDAFMIARRCTDRLEAFTACFAPEGSFTPVAARLQARLASTVGLSSGLTNLCFHACWLHHAANEHRSSRPSDARPFLRLVEWLALNFPLLDGVNV